MIIRVYYVSRREELREFASSRPEVVNTYEYLAKNGITCEVIAKREDELRALIMSGELLRDREKVDGCVLLLEQGLEAVVSKQIKTVAFACVFEVSPGPIASPQNVMTRDVIKAIRLFRSIKNAAQSDQNVWRLPIKNFDSPLYEEFVEGMTKGFSVGRADEVLNFVQAQLKVLRKTLVRPRRRTTYPTKYCVDDSKRFFELGHEVHSKIGTAEPHVPMCIALNSFRFGLKITEEHHYNVSMGEGNDTWIEGDFADCHGVQWVVTKRQDKTHLNMFSNDYF